MSESPAFPTPGPSFDATDPQSVGEWIAALPPAAPNMRPMAALAVKYGSASVYFRITRPALERVAGDATLSTPAIAHRFSDEIETQCLALLSLVDVEPAGGWILDVSDIPSIA